MNIKHIGWITGIVAGIVVLFGPRPLLASDDAPDEVAELAVRIDRHIAAAWETEGVVPAPLADDAEFLRRTYLNLAGTIPPVSEVREFLAETAPNRRRRLVDRLLDHPGYVNHFAHSWRLLMIPEADVDQQVRFLAPSFEGWLRDKFIDNAAYDDIARELIACPISGNEREGPVAFYRAKNVQPESVASSVSRLFLGVQLDCAQCHNHPFAEWEQKEFWAFTAFFAGIEGTPLGSVSDDSTRREIAIKGGDTVVQARFIDKTKPKWAGQARSREVLAEWITDKNNAYFARTGANRVWAHFFGSGIVNPPDNFDESNPPTHPALLDDLAVAFAAHDFDFKFLIRAITASETYQRSSRQTHASQADQRWLGRMPVKGLSPRQITDSLMQATGIYQQTNLRNRAFNVGNNGSLEAQITSLFENQTASNVDPQTTILQALALMNSQFVTQQTQPNSNSTLAAVLQAPFLDREGKIEALYLAALSRKPSDKELSRLRTFMESKPDEKVGIAQRVIQNVLSLGQRTTLQSSAQEKALADIYWALLNSSEFLFNH